VIFAGRVGPVIADAAIAAERFGPLSADVGPVDEVGAADDGPLAGRALGTDVSSSRGGGTAILLDESSVGGDAALIC
jgi:hypothetical protein